MSSTRLSLAALLVLSVVAAAPRALAGGDLAGDWTGWGYEESGGDFPLHLTIVAPSAGSPASIEIGFPHLGRTHVPTEVAELATDHVAFTQKDDAGRTWLWSATATKDGGLAGEMKFDGELTAKFELARSPEPLATIAKDRLARRVGSYRSAAGGALVVSAWSWGELRLIDLASGAVRTLFPVDDESFFTGPAEYVPDPIESRIEFRFDADGAVTSLVRTVGSGKPEEFARNRFVEDELTWSCRGADLSGTLISPNDGARHPAVIVIGGSGWTDRRDVRLDADAFAALGYAALIFDRRGCGRSTGDRECPFDDIAADAAAGAELLAKRDDIDPTRIGVFGRSRGGWIAPLAATHSPAVGFVLLFVAPAISPARQETTRRLNEMRAAGATEAQVARARAHLDLLWKSFDSDEAWDAYLADRKEVEHEPWFQHVGDIESRDGPDYVWMKRNMRHDPIPVFEKVTCPVLAFFGGSDTNVTPDENLAPMREALERAGNAHAQLIVVPGSDHGLSADPPGTPLHRRQGQAPQVWPTISRFIDELGKQPN